MIKAHPSGEIREVGRGLPLSLRDILFRQPFGLPPSPKEKAWALPRQYRKDPAPFGAGSRCFTAVTLPGGAGQQRHFQQYVRIARGGIPA